MFNRSKAWALTLLGAIFLGGLIAGAGTQRLLGARDRDDQRHERRRLGYVERLTVDLGLTAPQQDSVRAIVDRTRSSMETLWRTVRPAYDSLRASMQQQIAAQLDAEQRDAYRQLIENAEKRRRERESGERSGSRDRKERKP